MSWELRKNGKLSAIQHCSECGEKLEPIFKSDKEPDTWFWLECDACQEPICTKCSDFDDSKSYGWRVCVTCLQDQMLKSGEISYENNDSSD